MWQVCNVRPPTKCNAFLCNNILWSDHVKLWHRILECVNTKANIVLTVKHDFTMKPAENVAFPRSHTACCAQCPVCIRIDGCHIFRPRLYIATYSRIEIIDASLSLVSLISPEWRAGELGLGCSRAVAAVALRCSEALCWPPFTRSTGILQISLIAACHDTAWYNGVWGAARQIDSSSLHLTQKLNRRNMPPFVVLLTEIIKMFILVFS